MLSNHLLLDIHVHLLPLLIRGVCQMYDHRVAKQFRQLLSKVNKKLKIPFFSKEYVPPEICPSSPDRGSR